MSELLHQKSWAKRNWKWLVPITALLIIIIAALSLTSGLTNFAQAYTEPALYENAVAMARKHERTNELMGTLHPIDKLNILEGNVAYSNENHHVEMTFRLTGSKNKGKMDIIATRKDGVWHYETIKIRIKQPQEEIVVLQNSNQILDK